MNTFNDRAQKLVGNWGMPACWIERDLKGQGVNLFLLLWVADEQQGGEGQS